MYLHFSDWTRFANWLDEKHIPHGDKIIKIYASEKDPREILGNPNKAVIESNGNQFTKEEIFSFAERDTYKGTELEEEMTKRGILNEETKRCIRALFRFANLPETNFCQYAMSIKKEDGSWVFKHPIDTIDSLELAALYPESRRSSVHLDIFSEFSLRNLRKLVDIDQKELLIEWGREIKGLVSPGNGSPERKRFGLESTE